MKKTFLHQLIDLFFGSLLVMFLGVITTPIITRLVQPDMYGQFSLFSTYSSIAMSVFTLGLDQALCRYYFIKDDFQYKKGIFQLSLTLPIIISVLCGAIAIIIFQVFKWPNSIDIKYLLCLVAAVILTLIYRFATVLVRLSYRTKLYSLLNILRRGAYVAFAMFFLLRAQFNALYALIFATLLSDVICLFIAILSEKKYYRFSIGTISGIQETVKCSRLIKFGMPLIVSNGIMHIFQAMDKLCVSYFGTYTDVGIYAGAQSIVSIFAIIQSTFNTLWAPKAIEHFEKDKNDKQFFVKMNAYTTIVMFIIGATILLFKDIIILFLGEKYRMATYIFPFLMLNPIMYTISETTVQGIVFFEKTQKQIYIVAISALTNLFLNIVLIPILGSKGAAVSTGISYILFFALRTIISNHYYKIDFKLIRFYLLTLAFIILCTYSMFHSFNIIMCVLYIAFLIILYFLYRTYICELFDILINKLKCKKSGI